MRKSKIFLLSMVSLLIFQLAIPGLNYSAYAADSNFITFKYDNFSNDGRFKTNGVTSFVNGKLRLTPASLQQWGTAFNTDRVSLKNDRSFSTYFTFELSNGGGTGVGSADGIVFTVQTFSNAAGAAGGGMGYQGIQQSVGIEFDTWNNGLPMDPDANHIGLNFNGNINSTVTQSLNTSSLNMKNGTIHAWVDYDGVNKSIEVRVNKNSSTRPGTAALSQTGVDLTNILASSDVFVGFTAATGGAFQNHEITKWYFVNDYAPIDVNNKVYSQAPTGYVGTPTQQEDGTVKLVITATGGSQQNGIPLELTATNGAVVQPATVTTDSAGKAEVIVSSPTGSTITSTVKIEGPGGIYKDVIVNIPGQTAAPLADRIVANATDGEITLSGVPEHVTVTIYDHEGEVIVTKQDVTGGTVTFSDILDLSIDEDIQVTYKSLTQSVSNKTSVRPKIRSEVIQELDIRSNGTTSIVYVKDVESGATIRVYDPESGLVIGQAVADGNTNPLAIPVTEELVDLQLVDVTIQKSNELESYTTTATTTLDISDTPIKVEVDATTDFVTVKQVPDGAKVIIYDKDGDEIASVYNRTGATNDMIVDLFPPGIELGDQFEVSIIEVKKYESDKVQAEGKVRSSVLSKDKIAANGSTDEVKVSDVPVGATIIVYDDNGEIIGEATNSGSSEEEVTVIIAKGLAEGQEVYVTQEEDGKLESEATKAIVFLEKSTALEQVEANANNDTVTVRDVPVGATITVYAEDGTTVIGTATNNGNEADKVVVAIQAPGLNKGDIVQVSITEKDKLESELVLGTAKQASNSLDEKDITADGTARTVTVMDVPAGATIIVYDEDGKELGRVTQGEEDGALTLTNLTNMGENILVSIALEGELASEPVTKAVSYEQSTALTANNVAANATKDTVTVKDVPAGATITVYAADGTTKIGTATNNGSDGDAVVVTINAPGLNKGTIVNVTIREQHKAESDVLEVTAEFEKAAPLDTKDIVINATKDIVIVTNVPKGGKITVYDADGTTEIGTETNGGNDEDIVIVTIEEPGLLKGAIVNITITEPGKNESEFVSGTANVESDALHEENITADGTKGTVTVKDVPAGATIIVYDKDGKELGRVTQGDEAGNLTLTDLTDMGENILVSIALEGELASEPVTKAVSYEQSPSLSGNEVDVNATKNTVTVKNVPAGATITVYAADGTTKIGTATNNGNDGDAVVVTIDAPGLNEGDKVNVTIREQHKAESEAVEVTAENEQGAPLDSSDIAVNATKNIVTVTNVPKDGKITVYAADGITVIGTGTNNGNDGDTVVVTIDAPGLAVDDTVKISITEPGKNESESTTSSAKVESSSLAANQVVANATNDTVAVTTVPVGAEVKVYRANGDLIGSKVNTGDQIADVIITIAAPGISSGETLYVTITETDKLPSEKTSVAATLQQATAPTVEQLIANATNDRIYVKDAPAGATVKVYDLSGKLLMSRKNTTSATSDLVLTMIPGFVAGNQFAISFSQANLLESTKTTITAYDQSKALTVSQVKDINVGKDTIVLQDIPAGATVIAYDASGKEIGRATNNTAGNGEITITGQLISSTVNFTILEVGKLQSESATIDLELSTMEQIDDALRRLSIGFQVLDTWESVTLDVFLVTVGAHDTSVAWNSSKSDVVNIEDPTNGTIEATVVRKENDESVILTAVVSKNGLSKSKTFLLIVKSSDLTKEENPTFRTVDVAGGESDYVLPIFVNRIVMSNGSKIDKTIFDPTSSASFIGEPSTQNSPAKVIVDEYAADQADEYAIEIPQRSVNSLTENGNSLEIITEYGQLKISTNELAKMNESFLDLFFRFVPVKSEEKQDELNDQLKKDAAVRQEAAGRNVAVLGSSLEIETNYSNYETTLFIPFAKNGIVVPTTNVNSFLDSLRVFIEHSDGEKVVMTGTIIYEGDVPTGLAIEISKFSTFTIFQLLPSTSTHIPVVEDEVTEPSEPAHHTAYILGYEDGTFRAENSIKRSEMATILFRVNELEIEKSVSQLYPDVPTSHWASSYIERLNSLKWMIGDINGNFRPESGITRAEMAIIITRWLDLSLDNADVAPFSDVANNHWASQAIAAVHKAGYMIGYEGNTFNPKHYLTRAEAVTIINRVLNRGPLTKIPAQSWSDVSPDHWAYGEIEEASRDHYYVTVDGEKGEQFVDKK